MQIFVGFLGQQVSNTPWGWWYCSVLFYRVFS